ncbi:MAG: hypothetical protein EZS26_000974 [Candidatus Ordinivivax streblomastigis]|uniref:Uncharacterized protein n=1 Tax=Candidatus Ordinivivax streblomastigis TaxID=2540710 RepID=A0A5M8P328_9BACT|nr:MAG: hypothetical protein EZS26_000974 [Candidatus Ordinivivax streblomastigis]
MKKTSNEEYIRLIAEERTLRNQMKELVIATLKENNGRITFTPENEDDEYPVSATLWGKHDSPIIDISDVYLKENDEIYADGIDQQTGILEKEFRIYKEQYSDVLHFIGAVLNWKDTVETETDNSESGQFEVTILFGSEVVEQYEETGEIPSEDWLDANGGVVDTKGFKSKELMDAYLEGIADADGWLETLVLDPFMVELLEQKRKM